MGASQSTVSASKLVATGVYLLVWPVMQMWLAGDWGWVPGWILGGWLVVVSASVIGWLYRRDPGLLAERYRRPGTGGQSRADARVVYLLVVGFVVWIAVPPLDARRLHWTRPWPGWLYALGTVLGAVLLLGAAFFLFRALADNSFASPLVRIQDERRQRVVSTGVYGVVRHPMYLGATLMFVGGPLLQGSAWGLLIGAALVVLLMVRIGGEEKLLVRELDGYEAYRERVRFRLLPGIW